jgi:hypothetical protein
MATLTSRTLATGVTTSDLIHIVITGDTSQSPDGSSYKATLGQVASLIGSGTSGTSGSSGSSGSSGTNGTSGTSNLTYWASAYSTVDQLVSVAGTTYKMSADSFSTVGIVVSGNTKFVVPVSGVYNIQFSVQLEKNSGAKSTASIWLSKNGTQVPNSNTEVTLDGANGDRVVAAWNWLDAAIFANDYYEIEWTSSLTNTFLSYDGAPSYGPEIPSVIITIYKI